jgi:hypothetical protein
MRLKGDAQSQQAKYMDIKMAWLKKASEELMAKLVAEGLEGERFKVFMNISRQEFGPKVLSIDSMTLSTLQGRHIWNISASSVHQVYKRSRWLTNDPTLSKVW